MLLLSRSDVSSLLSLTEYIDAVEQAFRLHAEGRSLRPVLTHVDCEAGEFHVKAGGLVTEDPRFAVKVNGGFSQNEARYGLPNMQGMIMLASAATGSPLAIMDSAEITQQRTAAATALAARYLASKNSTVCTVCGAGKQALAQLRAIQHEYSLKKIYVWSRTAEHATACAMRAERALGVESVSAQDLSKALRESQICVTCTTSHQPFLKWEFVHNGLFIAAIGADSPAKQELDPRIFAEAKVVTDLTDQAAEVGDVHHAIQAGLMGRGDVYAELGQLVTGNRPGRENEGEITVFDSTGTALQDVAAADAVYRKAAELNVGQGWELA